MINFKDFNLSSKIQQALDAMGFTTPTEIQKKAFDVLLKTEKVDFHGQAQTGTGKTLAFGIPLLQRLDETLKQPQALIVAPTRELALQIRESLVQVAKNMGIKIEAIYGGVSMDEQLRNLRNGVHIVVGTPGRLNDHLNRKTLNLSKIRTLVLDEADIMLDMGFKEEVDEILTHAPKDREIWLFSATVKSGISDIMRTHMKQPVSVRVSQKQVGTGNTKQYFCAVGSKSRLQALGRFIDCAQNFYGFIFCQTKILTSEVAELLIKRGYNVGALHGDMSQAQRNLVIKKFKEKELNIVVATDVAARGIDIANLTHVINFSIPEDHESYIHRIGRTGRAGKEGIAITFINRSELRSIEYIQKKFNLKIEPIDVPSKDLIIKSKLEEAATYLNSLVETPSKNSQVDQLVESLPIDSIKKVISNLVYDKFLKNIDSEDINFVPANRIASQSNLQEIYINVGSDDGITQNDVVDFLVNSKAISNDQIHKIRVIKRRTFIELPPECAPKLMSSLRGQSLGGRRTRIDYVPQEQQQQRERSERPYYGGRGGRGRY